MNLKSKKIKNNKGFSLIELLAAIVVLSIISVITIVGISRYLASARDQKTVQNKKNVSVAAELYLQANRDLLPKMIGENKKIKLSELRNANYIKEDVTNSAGEDCMKKSYVYVVKLTETDYSYNTVLVCGNDPVPEGQIGEPPYLEPIKNSDGEKKKIVFSKSSDVKTANFSFKLRGSQKDPTVKIASYSYVIQGKTNQDTKYTELYNSGIIDGGKETVIEFRSKSLSEYVDLTGVTHIRIKLTALNEDGGYLTYDEEELTENATGTGKYRDTEGPICPPKDDEAARLGEPKSLTDWVNKRDIGTTRYPRIITLKCDDGNGSGCKRETFSEAWPNINETPYGIMFGTINLEDNNVMDDEGVKKEASNTTPCDINVFVDLQAPTIEITPINPKTGAAVGENIELFGKKVNDYQTIVVADPTDVLNEDVVTPELTITSTNYKNNYHLSNPVDGWLNKKYYPEGIKYKVHVKDNIYLSSVTWETNKPYFGSDYEGLQDVSLDNIEATKWIRSELPKDDPMYVDDNELVENKRTLTEAQNEIEMINDKGEMTIGFYEEGARYGILTAKDKAGNETKIYIQANLDRTAPLLAKGEYDVLAMDIPEVNTDEPAPYVDEERDPEDDLEYEVTGRSPWERDPDSNLPVGFGALLRSKKFANFNWGNEYSCWPCWGGGGGGYGWDPYDGNSSDMLQCTNKSKNGYGIIKGTEYSDALITDKYGRENTGCYKVGAEHGDNQFSGEPMPDYLDTEVFLDLVRNGEYKSGTWSNEELLCGPHDNSTYDNLITKKDADGNEIQVENPNGENVEISKWAGMNIDYYQQIGVKRDPYDSSKIIPKYDEENPVPYTITKRDRTQWPVFQDQGTHKLIWSNCDAAGNCTGEALREFIKIDTIAPQCNNSVSYDDNKNSDGDVGKPNHNGWLYDEQVATVSHDCADTSIKEYGDYFLAYLNIKAVTLLATIDDFSEYKEFGSGCTNEAPTTDTMEYSEDVYTCEAGTEGIGPGYLGKVEDYAGNIRECQTGATIRKDTRPPICITQAHYSGKNGDGDYNMPNHNDWAMDGMSIYTTKSCDDKFYALKGNYPGAHVYATSGCTSKDNFAINNIKTRIAVNSDFQYSEEEIPKERDTVTGDYYFKPDNNAKYSFEDGVDVYGEIGATALEEVDGKMVYKKGFIVDRAGNISDEECVGALIKRDIAGPGCKNDVTSPNNMYSAPTSEGTWTPSRAQAWTTEGSTPGSGYSFSRDYDKAQKWFGMSGRDGNAEYAQVQKGCVDVSDRKNYPGMTNPEYVMSGCSGYRDSNKEVWYYGNIPGQENASNVSYVDLFTSKTFTNATYMGPTNKIIMCSDEVTDDAGNHGGGIAEPITINLDYVQPTCGTIELTQGSDMDYAPRAGMFYWNSSAKFKQVYTPGSLTNKVVTPMASCAFDEDSGCLKINGAVRINDEEFKSWTEYDYDGKNSDQFTEVYAFDIARNKIKCERTFSLKQDTVLPEVASCKFKANYSRDKAADSYVEITINGITDPPADPDGYASGVDFENSYINSGIKVLDSQHAGHWAHFYYYNEDDPYLNTSNGYYYYKDYVVDGQKINDIVNGKQWRTFYMSNERLTASEPRGERVRKRVMGEDSFYVKSPLSCSSDKSKVFPIVVVYDKAGNANTFPCEPETPEDDITIPACCDETVGTVTCDDWQWTECTKKCDSGEQHEERHCSAESKYRDNKICKWTARQSEGTVCNERKCCDKKEKVCGVCSNDFDTDNPCSYGQKECLERSEYDENVICVSKHIESCQNDQDKCKTEIEKAKNAGNERAIEVGKAIKKFVDEEKWIEDEETGEPILLEKVVRNGVIQPFEYQGYNSLGTRIYKCYLDEAKEYLKDEYKNQVTDCSEITPEMYNVDEDNNLFKSITLYNYVASPSSCQIYINKWYRDDWVIFSATDQENCKMDTSIEPSLSNCKQLMIDEANFRSRINKMGSYDINGQTARGCNLNVQWQDDYFTFYEEDSMKYKKQNYVAVKCYNEKTKRNEYCMDSCSSGICVPGGKKASNS